MVRSSGGQDTGLRTLIPGGLAGDEAEHVEDLSQSDPGSGFGEVDARHGSAPGDWGRIA